MKQNQLPSLVWGIKNASGFSLRIVVTDDLSLAVATIKGQLKNTEIVSDVWSIKSSADVSVMVVKDQSEEWFKRLDREIETIKKIVDHVVVLLVDDNSYRQFMRHTSYCSSYSQFYSFKVK